MRINKTEYDRYQRAFGSIEGLAQVASRLTQEVEVLKTMLRDKGLWDDAGYKKALVERLIADHSSAGIGSYVFYSDYPYALEEASYLQYRFDATEEEIAAFNREVDRISTLT